MKTPNYEIITKRTVYSIGESDEERQALIDEQWDVLRQRGYDSSTTYIAHFFDSAFSDDETTTGNIDDLIEMLAIKDGVDLVQFEDGAIGFMAYYNGKENGFELFGGYKETRQRVEEYIDDVENNYKHDFIKLWETCCDISGWLDLDAPSAEAMVDIVMDYNNSLFDENLKKILAGKEDK